MESTDDPWTMLALHLPHLLSWDATHILARIAADRSAGGQPLCERLEPLTGSLHPDAPAPVRVRDRDSGEIFRGIVIPDPAASSWRLFAAAEIEPPVPGTAPVAALTRAASQSTSGIILTDAKGRVLWTNPSFTRITGYPLAEVLGRTPGTFLQGPDTDPATVRLMRNHLRRGHGFHVEILNYRKSGEPIWISMQVDPLFDRKGELLHFIATQQDVSRRRFAREVRNTRVRVNELLAKRPPLPEACEGTAEHLGQLIGAAAAEVWFAEDPAGGTRRIATWRGNSEPAHAFEWLEAPPDSGPLSPPTGSPSRKTVTMPIGPPEEPIGWILFHGIPRQALDPEIEELFQQLGTQLLHFIRSARAECELIRARDAARAAYEAKSVLLATMSHEIRASLNNILGFTRLLERQAPESLPQDHLKAINDSAGILLKVIDQSLDFSSLESGQFNIDLHTVRLADLIGRTVTLHQPLADEKGLFLEWSVHPDVPEFVELDPTRFQQILINLISNALRFTHHGGVRIEAAMEREMLRVEVIDSGPGFDPAQAEAIFAPYHRASEPLEASHHKGGTGLGLAICRTLCERLGGGIRASAKPGEGAVFTFSLPIRRVGDEPAGSSPQELMKIQELPPSPAVSNRPPTIILAEDDPLSARMMKIMLRHLGFAPLLAGDGHQLLALAARTPRCSAIIIDVQLPGMSGPEAARRIRAGEAGPAARECPLIALTASVLPAQRAECQEAGMNAFLAKPFDPAKLTRVLANFGVAGARR